MYIYVHVFAFTCPSMYMLLWLLLRCLTRIALSVLAHARNEVCARSLLKSFACARQLVATSTPRSGINANRRVYIEIHTYTQVYICFYMYVCMYALLSPWLETLNFTIFNAISHNFTFASWHKKNVLSRILQLKYNVSQKILCCFYSKQLKHKPNALHMKLVRLCFWLLVNTPKYSR